MYLFIGLKLGAYKFLLVHFFISMIIRLHNQIFLVDLFSNTDHKAKIRS